ncbi:MAG: hypothetical protein MZV70_05070, partial [Desulfobacterales bacterium]|nr:hypothetical protein [Desulfobacterales bacterium]
TAVSLAGNLPMIYARKEAKDYGTKRVIEGAFAAGETVVLIDDVITDGASKFEAAEPLAQAGLAVKDFAIFLRPRARRGRPPAREGLHPPQRAPDLRGPRPPAGGGPAVPGPTRTAAWTSSPRSGSEQVAEKVHPAVTHLRWVPCARVGTRWRTCQVRLAPCIALRLAFGPL